MRVKLFNLLLAELGPLVLARGLILEQGELKDLLKNLDRTDTLPASANPVLVTVSFRE